MRPSLWTLNVMTTCPLQRHRRVGHEPVALHLGDEAAQPRPELDALGVELDRRVELVAAVRVVELLILRVAMQVPQRLAERAAGGGRRARRGLLGPAAAPAAACVGSGAARAAAASSAAACVLARLAPAARLGLRGRLRPPRPSASRRCGLGQLGRVAAHERLVVGRVRVALARARLAILVGHRGRPGSFRSASRSMRGSTITNGCADPAAAGPSGSPAAPAAGRSGAAPTAAWAARASAGSAATWKTIEPPPPRGG